MNAPEILDHSRDHLFDAGCVAAGLDPNDTHVAHYVAWEWDRARHLFEEVFFDVRGKDVLEVGFHLAATAIVLAQLGAKSVEGIDVDERLLIPARTNIARYGFSDDRIELHTGKPRRISYDVISCISCLEYVEPSLLGEMLLEFDDLLKPGGHLVIYGSSNRLFPRESHGGGFDNYVPRAFDPMFRRPLRRGLSPLKVRSAFAGYQDLCAAKGGSLLLELRKRTKGRGLVATRLANALLTPFGAHAGYVLPHVAMVLRKPPRDE